MDMSLLRSVILLHKSGDHEGALGSINELVKAVYNRSGNVIHSDLAALLLGTQLQLLAAQSADEQARKYHLQRAEDYLCYAKDIGSNCTAAHGMRAAVHLENYRMEQAEAVISDALRLSYPDDPNDLRVDLTDSSHIYIGDVSDLKITESVITVQPIDNEAKRVMVARHKIREFCNEHVRRIHIAGARSILITNYDCKILRMKKQSLYCYIGEVKLCGLSQFRGRKATIFCLGDNVAQYLHDCLVSISHPHILSSLGHGRGLGSYSMNTFLAVPFFSATFRTYLQSIELSVYMDRYTDEFIILVSHIVKAILGLHSLGYCCKDMEADHIVVVEENKSISAKIWHFKKCSSDEEKTGDWKLLGELLNTSKLKSDENSDLCAKLCKAELRGLDILAHSALLTARKKLQNVLTLFKYQETDWKTANSPGAPNWLDDKFDFSPKMPLCIHQSQSFKSCPIQTFRTFTEKLRDVIEHEVDYLPLSMVDYITFKDREQGRKEEDFEYSLRHAWPKEFLKIQNFVREKKLTY
ncbi:uncharacterized protein [Triticum aestivum]|uniref:uncharacterized protein n=1 Tax=Triticum aestivum TaxID=4565 RepID=UPI000844C978|nr:uncharacterized protein LOC123111244 [Triticum aestivum]XP_044387936.1 uncharacterized protein LOC123111244 [Triticum aestivum]XP_044387937.1 uncharacterized protein LOC123111244 [Triticum aestivum]